MDTVCIFDSLDELFDLERLQLDIFAQHFALVVDLHAHVIAGADYAIAAQNLAEILGLVFDALWRIAVNRQIVVLIGQLRLGACQFDCLQTKREKQRDVIDSRECCDTLVNVTMVGINNTAKQRHVLP